MRNGNWVLFLTALILLQTLARAHSSASVRRRLSSTSSGSRSDSSSSSAGSSDSRSSSDSHSSSGSSSGSHSRSGSTFASGSSSDSESRWSASSSPSAGPTPSPTPGPTSSPISSRTRSRESVPPQEMAQLESLEDTLFFFPHDEGEEDGDTYCGAKIPNRLEKDAAEMRLLEEQERNGGRRRLCVNCVMIDTYFHIVANTADTDGNMADWQVNAQIAKLNEGFDETPFQFNLVNITRTLDSDLHYLDGVKLNNDVPSMQSAFGDLLRQGNGSRKVLNIYSLKLRSRGLGVATFPTSFAGSKDGAFIDHCTVPGGSGCGTYNTGDIAVHEVGHWLGLLHTFEGGCNAEHGDYVSDTSPQALPKYSCPPQGMTEDSCPTLPGVDPHTNIMGYGVACYEGFTVGQKSRMHDQWKLYREGTSVCGTDEGILTIDINTDFTPEDNFWRLYQANGQLIAMGEFGESEENTRSVADICLAYNQSVYFGLGDTGFDGLSGGQSALRVQFDGRVLKDDTTFDRWAGIGFTMLGESACAVDEAFVAVDLLLDYKPSETSWRIEDSDRKIVYIEDQYLLRSSWSYFSGASVRREMCLPQTGVYYFVIEDTGLDGFSSTRNDDVPFFQVHVNGSEVVYQELFSERFEWSLDLSPPRSNSPSMQPSVAEEDDDALKFGAGFPSSHPSISMIPSFSPTARDSLSPSTVPSQKASLVPSIEPTLTPTGLPSGLPSLLPTGWSSSSPTARTSVAPSLSSSVTPTTTVSTLPSTSPSQPPTIESSSIPSIVTTHVPSFEPSESPTSQDSTLPTLLLSESPSTQASNVPSVHVSSSPTGMSSQAPSDYPSESPTLNESAIPTTTVSIAPSVVSSNPPSMIASVSPTVQLSNVPSDVESSVPTVFVSGGPSVVSSSTPTVRASQSPSLGLSATPTVEFSVFPTMEESSVPTTVTSDTPSFFASSAPSVQVSFSPSVLASEYPSLEMSGSPTIMESSEPSTVISNVPSITTSTSPSVQASLFPSLATSSSPTVDSSDVPTIMESVVPTRIPSEAPSTHSSTTPSMTVSSSPSMMLSMSPTIRLKSSAPSRISSSAPSIVVVPTQPPLPIATGFLLENSSTGESWTPSDGDTFDTNEIGTSLRIACLTTNTESVVIIARYPRHTMTVKNNYVFRMGGLYRASAEYTVSCDPYSEDNQQGRQGARKSVTFTLI